MALNYLAGLRKQDAGTAEQYKPPGSLQAAGKKQVLTLYYPILDYPAGIRVVRTVRHRSNGISRVRYDTFRADAFFAGGQQIWNSAYIVLYRFPGEAGIRSAVINMCRQGENRSALFLEDVFQGQGGQDPVSGVSLLFLVPIVIGVHGHSRVL